MKHTMIPLITASIAALLALPACNGEAISNGDALAQAAPTEGDKAVAILNAGVRTELGEVKFLFDPIYDNHFGSLAEMTPSVTEAIVSGVAPYDAVDAVFVSHAHGDHFSAQHLNRLLAAQSGVQLIAPAQAIEAMQAHQLWQDGFADRVTSVTLENGADAMRFEIAGAQVEAIRTPHAGWPDRHAQVHNITFRISAPSGARVMHMGDADPAEEHFAPHSTFFANARTGLAFVPFWFLNEEDADHLFDQTLNVEQPVGVHVPVSTPGFLSDGKWEFFSGEGQEVAVPATP
ncbi:MAG: MBL fold metallo-hydrolase [Erythrobacter sp.]